MGVIRGPREFWPQLRVVGIERIESAALWEAYTFKREDIRAKLADNPPTSPTTPRLLDPSINEVCHFS